jgi:uncharacterized membrane protein YfcA
MYDIFAVLASVAIGITLGLIGGGGSILTVPVLVYLFAIDPILSTTYSLFIVGSTSVVGSISYIYNKSVNIRTAIVFGIPSVISVYFSRYFILPVIPDELIQIGKFQLTKNVFLLLLFAVLMIFASYNMIKRPTNENEEKKSKIKIFGIVLQGAFVGLLTGLVGAGGGFLIVPAIIIFAKLPMKVAVGTSLIIISANSFIGFLVAYKSNEINWNLLLFISGLAILGIFIGMLLSKKIDGAKLKPAFGWFVLVMGLYIVVKELIF